MRARLYDYTSCPDFCGFVSPEHWRNVGSFCAAPPSTEARSSGNRTANHSAVFVPQLFRAIDKLAVGESHEVRTHTNYTSFRLSCGLRRSKNRETAGIFGTGCGNVGPRTRTQAFPTWSGLHPDTPHQCVSAQCGFRFSSASSSIRSLRSVIDLRRAVSPLACCR